MNGDAALISANIKRDKTIFGVSGDANVVDTSSGDAGAAEIVKDKKAYVAGSLVTGMRPLAPLPKTGQTTSDAVGDDGDLEKGVAWPNPRFTDNSNGTVTDNLTGLIWLKNANCVGPRSWAEALTWSNSLASGSCGLTDSSTAGQWRLPNVNELLSLIDRSRVNPALPVSHPFTGVRSGLYCSSATYAPDASRAWYVGLGGGGVNAYDKSGAYYVWPVRGGL